MGSTSKKKRSTSGSKPNDVRNVILDNMGIACTNAVGNNVYLKLRTEGRLQRFVAVIKVCSTRGNNIKETVDELLRSFPGYIDSKELNEDVFKDMLRNHYEISEAWGFGVMGDEVNKQIIADVALDIALKSNDITVIKEYNSMYNKENSGIVEEDITDNKNDGIKVNFNVTTLD